MKTYINIGDLYINLSSINLYMKDYNNIILGIGVILAVLHINTCTNLISTYLILYVLSYKYFRKCHKALLYALFLLCFFIVLKILLGYNEKYLGEHYENKNEDKNEEFKKLDESFTKKELENLSNLSKEEITNLEKEKIDEGESSSNESSSNESSSNESSSNESLSKKDSPEEFISLDAISPMLAQKELYRLVNTSKLLKDTMLQLTPVLKEGGKIMKAFEQLNMVKK